MDYRSQPLFKSLQIDFFILKLNERITKAAWKITTHLKIKKKKKKARYEKCLERCSKWIKTGKDTGCPSMPHQVMPSQYLCLYGHTRTNSANKSNSAVHRRFTTKALGRDGAVSCCLITDLKSLGMISYMANSVKPFSSGWCFSNQSIPVILIADGFSCTNTASVQSNVATQRSSN